MPDNELLSLWITLVILYLLEGVVFVPHGAVAFVWTRGLRLRARFAPGWLRNDRGGVVFGTPWPWCMGVILADGWRFGVSADGLFPYRLEELDPERSVQLATGVPKVTQPGLILTDGRYVILRGLDRIGCATVIEAEEWHARGTAFLKLTLEQRESFATQWMADRADTAHLAKQLDAVARATLWLRVWGTLTTVLALVGLPVVAMTLGLVDGWPYLLLAVYGSGWFGAMSFYRTHRKLWPKRRADRWTQVILQVLVPIVTMRATEFLVRTAAVGFHPVAVATVGASKGHLDVNKSWIHHMVRDLWAARATEVGSGTMDVAQEAFHTAWSNIVRALLVTPAMNDLAKMSPPEPESDAMLHYCPRCLAQFPKNVGLCSDCGGIRLLLLRPESTCPDLK